MRTITCFIGLIGVLSALGDHATAATPMTFYRATDLSTLGGDEMWSSGLAINSQGHVAGLSDIPPNTGYHAFLYSDGVMQDLGTLGGNESRAYGINDNDEVVGWSDLTGTYPDSDHAFLYSQGVMTDIGTLGSDQSLAWGINNSGQVVGSAAWHIAFSYSNGVMTDLGSLGAPNNSQAAATAINSSGQIVGLSSVGNTARMHAFLYSNGVMTDLTPGANILNSQATAITDNGRIVGTVQAAVQGAQQHAAIFSGGGVVDLGTLGGYESIATGVNSSGQLVGYSDIATTSGVQHAFASNGGAITDLNDLTAINSHPTADWYVYKAAGINDAGQIVATLRSPGSVESPGEKYHAAVLNPVAGVTTSVAIDPSQSGLTLSADINGFPFIEQTPGSLTSALAGSLTVDLIGSPGAWTDIRFHSANPIQAVGHAGPFQPGNGPADLASFVSLDNDGEPLLASLASRNTILDASSGFLSIGPDGGVSLDGLLSTLTTTIDYDLPGIISGSGGAHASGPIGGRGSVVQVGNTLYITIPIDLSFTTQPPELGGGATFNYRYTGQIVATATVPEPSTFALAGLAILGLPRLLRRH
ncbi:MAG TPA: DUF3466 family protein [Pirellulales bacterium]|jgi:probable HAF family extracellular repeat protein